MVESPSNYVIPCFCADCGTEWAEGHWCDGGPGSLPTLRTGVEWTRPARPFLRVFFAWYDFWIGAYWDRAKRILYVCPLPCCVFRFDFRPRAVCLCGAMTDDSHFHWCQIRRTDA